MNEMIKVGESEFAGELKATVNLRELHGFLEVGRDFPTWVKSRIEEYGFVEGVDYILCSPNLGSAMGSGGRNRIDYFGTLDMAKELAMVERNDKGREARRYFIECERKLKESKKLSPAEYLVQQAKMLLAIEQEQFRLAEEQKQQQVRLANIEARIDASTGYMTVKAFCKLHHIPCPLSHAQFHGKNLSKLCRNQNLLIGSVSDEVFGTVNSYPIHLMEEYFELDG